MALRGTVQFTTAKFLTQEFYRLNKRLHLSVTFRWKNRTFLLRAAHNTQPCTKLSIMSCACLAVPSRKLKSTQEFGLKIVTGCCWADHFALGFTPDSAAGLAVGVRLAAESRRVRAARPAGLLAKRTDVRYAIVARTHLGPPAPSLLRDALGRVQTLAS